MAIPLKGDGELQAQLELASQVQQRLLPERQCCLSGWEVSFSYEPSGFVSGDYVDLIPSDGSEFYFALGDVSGKGVAASILMSHLHAALRTLLPSTHPISEVLAHVSSTFCYSTLPAQFATLVLGKADQRGNLELVNAGHTPGLLVQAGKVEVIAGTSLPLGMFCATEFISLNRNITSGSMLLLYSDGITESTDNSGREYDQDRLIETLLQSAGLSSPEVVEAVRRNIADYTNGAEPEDDRTILALQYLPNMSAAGL